MMVSSVGDQSVCLDNNSTNQPLTDVKSIELQMECDAIGTTNVVLCIYLTDQPFEEGDGTYHTITVPLNLNCTGLYCVCVCMCVCVCVYVCVCVCVCVYVCVYTCVCMLALCSFTLGCVGIDIIGYAYWIVTDDIIHIRCVGS